MPDTPEAILKLHQYWHAPAKETAERWTAMHRAGWQISEREPTDDELPLLRAATTHKEAA